MRKLTRARSSARPARRTRRLRRSSRLLALGCLAGILGVFLWQIHRGDGVAKASPIHLPLVALLGWAMRGREPSFLEKVDLEDPLIAFDADGRVVHANRAAYRVFAIDEPDPEELGARVLGAPELRRLLAATDLFCGEFFAEGEEAGKRCFEVRVSHPPERPGFRVLVMHDVTARRESQDQLYRLAHFDSLTGLPNRRFSRKHLDHALANSKRSKVPLALIGVDLDRFKVVNDSWGHAAGDTLLRVVAQRLRQHLRADDSLGTAKPTVARLGGDEFVVALPCPQGREDAAHIAKRLLTVLAEPIAIEGRTIRSGGSVGIAFYPQDASDAEGLLRATDVALYHAKENGRGNYQFFHADLTESAQRKASIDTHLRNAFARNELELYYQPKRSAESGVLTGAEGLVRWNSAELGRVSPSEFVPVAEEFGIIGELGAWVADRACAQIAEWRAEGRPVVPVSINVSPLQLEAGGVEEMIAGSLRRHGLEARWLEVELTESAILEDARDAIETLEDLRSFGVRIALDDFGSGYSSLGYLNRVPIDVLKLDRTFLRDLHLDRGVEKVVSAVVSMAKGLEIEVVAEGVDSEDQLAILERVGCDTVQGFLTGAPIPASEFAELLCEDAPERPKSKVVPAAPAAEKKDWGDFPVLVVDSEHQGELGVVAMRLNRMGVVTLYASSLEEGLLITSERKGRVGALLCDVGMPAAGLASLVAKIESAPGERPGVVLVASDDAPLPVLDGDPQPRVLAVRLPVEDASLRDVIHTALIGGDRHAVERTTPRAPVDIIATSRFDDRKESVLLNSLSRHGAFLESDRPSEVGASVCVEFALDGTAIAAQGTVIYCVERAPVTGAMGFGVRFDPLPEEALRAIDSSIELQAARCAA